MGPYNKDLQDLANLSFDTKALSVIEEVLQKKLVKILAAANNPRRLYSTKSVRRHPVPPKRALSFHNQPLSLESKNELVVLKCLTVIVHLCQYGSSDFVTWLRRNYSQIIQPLGRLAFLPQYANAIYLKVSLVVRYCESKTELATSRKSVDEIRREIRPGIVGLPDSSPVPRVAAIVTRTHSPHEMPSILSMMEESTLRLSSNNPFVKHV